jgi:S1-C subfamily serine protease
MMHLWIALALLQATLGVETRAPTREEIKSYGLTVELKPLGQVVKTLADGGPAARAGLQAGDAIIKLGGVKIFSRDHLNDVLRVAKPGTEIEAVVKRKDQAEQTVKVTLGKADGAVPGGIAWEFASLEQLPAALEQAKKEKKAVLVGLSGAET